MQIIFDSEKQKEAFLRNHITENQLCPSIYGCKNARSCPGISCQTCWQMAIQMKVKDK